MLYDVIIIGGGPAGISASLYLKRAKINVLVINKGYGALEKAEKIENYYGLEKSISGKELFEVGQNQAKRLGIEFVYDEVIGIDFEESFKIITVNSEYFAKKVVLATGTNRKSPNIKGIKEYEGRGISYCAVCDAFFYKDKDVAVLGNGDYAIHEAEQLKPIVKDVTILTNGEKIIENRDEIDFNIEDRPIREFRGTDRIEEIEFENSEKKNISGVFIAVGTASSSDLARKIGAIIKDNNIVVNENMQTNIDGLYACGDCTGGILQINKAVYEGAKSALHIIATLKNEK